MSNIKTITLGCRFNYYESEVEKAMLGRQGGHGDFVIVNTCSVTHEAERQSKQAVRKAIKENVGAKIIVTGCAAKTAREYFRGLPGVFQILQNDEKSKFDVSQVFEEEDCLFKNRARVFLQIQNGCDNFCAYCIVPQTRGRSLSLSLENILEKVKYFVDHGFQEIVLSGIDITSYGKDLDGNFELADVIETILSKSSINRLRISSLDPNGINRRLLDLFSHEKRIMPHFHLSIQSGDNMVLRSMRRKHKREDVLNFACALKSERDGVVLGADFIAGFPSETDEMFENTLCLVDEAGLSLMHIFPFSPRCGTLAATMVQLPKKIIKERAKRLRKKSDEALQKTFNGMVGKNVNFIVEKSEGGVSFGKTDSFLPVLLESSQTPSEVVENCEVLEVRNKFLVVKKLLS